MEWKEVRLGDYIKTNETQYSIKENWENFVYLDTGSIIEGRIDTLLYFTKEDKLPSRARRKVQHGDIIYSCVRPNQRHYGYINNPVENLLVSTGFVVISCKDIDSKYLYYYLTQDTIINYLQNIGEQSVSTYPTIKPQDIEDIFIRIPSDIEDQRRIASILSSLDRKIELNNKINADLEEMAQAIFKNWFVDFEPFKDGKFVDSELGMIPEGWKVGCLGDLITIKYGKDHKKLDDGTFPVYGSGGFMRFVNSWLYNGESVLIPRKGTLDNIMYVCEKFWTVDTMFFSVPKMDYVMKYVYNYIKRFDFSKMNEGTSVPSNTAARLNKMQILIPTHEVLEMYDETLCPIYNKRKMNDKESRTLSLLRDTLLHRLMSGELEVPE